MNPDDRAPAFVGPYIIIVSGMLLTIVGCIAMMLIITAHWQ